MKGREKVVENNVQRQNEVGSVNRKEFGELRVWC